MKKLNLNDLDLSDIKYRKIKYPDGQIDIVIDPESVKVNFSLGGVTLLSKVEIISRFNSFEDLGLIICASKALRKLKIKEIHLYIPYILGARSDRQFNIGGTSYLVDVIAPILNAQGYESVTCIDIHSNVVPACINNLNSIDNLFLIEYALREIYTDTIPNYVLVAPDQGASQKIFRIAQEFASNNSIIFCTKHRDQQTGKITHTEVPLKDSHFSKPIDYLIVDDICDGGRTFIEIAKSINQLYKKYPNATASYRIFLIVSHGIFSQGFVELQKYVHDIFTTNSICDINKEFTFVHQIDVFNNF